jgi:hypothetical protein
MYNKISVLCKSNDFASLPAIALKSSKVALVAKDHQYLPRRIRTYNLTAPNGVLYPVELKRVGTPSWTRTNTGRILSPLSLPLDYRSMEETVGLEPTNPEGPLVFKTSPIPLCLRFRVVDVGRSRTYMNLSLTQSSMATRSLTFTSIWLD